MRDAVSLLGKNIQTEERVMEVISFYMVLDSIEPVVYIKLMEMKTGLTINYSVHTFQEKIKQNIFTFIL
jgi:hypothetical protein